MNKTNICPLCGNQVKVNKKGNFYPHGYKLIQKHSKRSNFFKSKVRKYIRVNPCRGKIKNEK